MKHILSFDVTKGNSVYCFIDELKNLKPIIINPKLVNQFKDTLNKSKKDKLDCLKIARCCLGTIDYFCYDHLSRQYSFLAEG